MQMLRSVAAALISLCLVLGEARAQSFDTGAPIAIGDIEMGLTLEEVRAALPAAEWQQDAERNPLGRRTMRASRALELFGALYDLEVEQGEGTDYQLMLLRDEQISGLDDCVQMGIALIQNLETRFGQFHESVTVPDFRRDCFNSSEMFCARGIETVSTSGGSVVRVLAKNAGGRLFQPNDMRDRRIRILALGSEKAFGPHYDDAIPRQTIYVGVRYEAGNCRLSVQIERSRLGF